MLFVNVTLHSIFMYAIFFTWMFTDYVSSQSAENFVVESYQWCANTTDPIIKTYINFKNFIPGNQIIDANLSSPIMIGENTMLTVFLEIQSKSTPKRWIYLFAIEDDFCRVIKMYIGEFWYETQTAAAVAPKTCPIHSGHYHIMNYKLNFKKLKLQTFPFGKLRITMQTQLKTTKETLSCSVGIVSNHISY